MYIVDIRPLTDGKGSPSVADSRPGRTETHLDHRGSGEHGNVDMLRWSCR